MSKEVRKCKNKVRNIGMIQPKKSQIEIFISVVIMKSLTLRCSDSLI